MTVVDAATRDVGRAKTTNTEQLVVRVPPELRERLQALIPHLAPPGVSITMTDVVRAALIHGVDALEAKHNAAKPRGRK
jgi:predicted DNA-binding protein